MATLSELLRTHTQEVDDTTAKGLRAQSTQLAAAQNPFLSTLGGTLLGSVGGGSLTAAGNIAGALGADQLSDTLYKSGQGLRERAAPMMAPQLDYTTVKDAGSAWDFAKANAAQGLGSMAPILLGKKLGGMPGGVAAGYLPQHGENVLRIKDDAALAGMTEGQIAGAAMPTAAAQAGLDYLVPGGVASQLGKKLGTTAGTRALGTLGATMGVEGTTELAQEELGMGMHSLLNPARDTAGDEHARIQSFLGGAVGGAPFGAVDAGVGYLQEKYDPEVKANENLKRQPLPAGMTDTEIGEYLKQRDMNDNAQAEGFAQELLQRGSERQKKLAEAYLAGDRSGQAGEVLSMDVRATARMEKAVEKARELGKKTREELGKGLSSVKGWFSNRLGNAQEDETGLTPLPAGTLPLPTKPDLAAGARGVDPAAVSAFSTAPFGHPQKVEHELGKRLAEYKADDTLTPIEKSEGILSLINLYKKHGPVDLTSQFRVQDVQGRKAAEVEAVLADPEMEDALAKWMALDFGIQTTGAPFIPRTLLDSDVDVGLLVQTAYKRLLLADGTRLTDDASVARVMSELNKMPKSKVTADDGQYVAPSGVGEDENGDIGDIEQNKEIGTNAFEANTLGGRNVYTGKSDKADVMYTLTDSDVQSQNKKMESMRAAGLNPRVVGVWDKLKDQFGGDEEGLYKAEDALLKKWAPETLNTFGDPSTDLASFKMKRETALRAIDQKYTYIAHEQNEAAEKSDVRGEDFRVVSPGREKNKWAVQTETFMGEYVGKPSNGAVWFQKDDGTKFATTTGRLIALGRKMQTTGEKYGAAEQRDALALGISSFMSAQESDGRPALRPHFGFSSKKGDVAWVDQADAMRKSSDAFELSAKGEGATRSTMIAYKGVLRAFPNDLKLYDGEVSDARDRGEPRGAPNVYHDILFADMQFDQAQSNLQGAELVMAAARNPKEKWESQQRIKRIEIMLNRAKMKQHALNGELRSDTRLLSYTRDLIERATRLGHGDEEIADVQKTMELLEAAPKTPDERVKPRKNLMATVEQLEDFVASYGRDIEVEQPAADDGTTKTSLEQDMADPNRAVKRDLQRGVNRPADEATDRLGIDKDGNEVKKVVPRTKAGKVRMDGSNDVRAYAPEGALAVGKIKDQAELDYQFAKEDERLLDEKRARDLKRGKELLAKEKPQLTKRLQKMIAALREKGVPYVVDVIKNDPKAREIIDRVYTLVASSPSKERAFEGMTTGEIDRVKTRAKAVLDALESHKRPTRTSLPTGGKRAVAKDVPIEKPRASSVPAGSVSSAALTPEVRAELEKQGYENIRPLVGGPYKTLSESVGTAQAVDGVFLYDGGKPYATETVGDVVLVGLRRDSVTAENYVKAAGEESESETVKTEVVKLGFNETPPDGVISTHRKGYKNLGNTGKADYGKADSGWLGNPYLANDVKGGVLTREQAVAKYRKDFLAKIEADPAFKAAVEALRGKKLGYYKPGEYNHVRVITEYLNSVEDAAAESEAKPEPVVETQDDAQYEIEKAMTDSWAKMGEANRLFALKTLKKRGIEKGEIRDITGEGRAGRGVRNIPPGLFTENGDSIDTIGRILAEEHFITWDQVADSDLVRDFVRKITDKEPVFTLDQQYQMYNKEAPGSTPMTPEERDAIKARVEKQLGPMALNLAKKGIFGMVGGKQVEFSADWQPGLIRIGINALNPMQKAMHEAMHELFHRMSQDPATKPALDKLVKAANSASVVRQLERLLADHPNAKMQIKEGTENYENERLAYMYQFWDAGALTIGPETQTWFTKLKDFLRELTGLLSDDQQAAKLLEAFSDGKFADRNQMSVVAKVMMADMNARKQLMKNAVTVMEGPLGRMKALVYTSHSTLHGSGYKSLMRLANLFDVPQGDNETQGMFEARKQMAAKFNNRLKNILMGVEPKDLEGVMEALIREDGVPPKDMKQYEVYRALRGTEGKPGLLDDLHAYITEAKVMRLKEGLGPGKAEWEKIPKREHYFPVVFDIIGREAEFAADLVKHESAWIVKRLKELKEDHPTDPKAQMEYAQAIAARLGSASGVKDLAETTSSIGFSPLMTAVNERKLDWTAPEMAIYRSKDIVSTMTNYIMQATKRAEYVRRFDNGGARIKQMLQDAYGEILAKFGNEMGVEGDKVSAYLMQRYATTTRGQAPEPLNLKDLNITMDQLTELETKALKEISKHHNAVMALEGTLGYDINPKLRELSAMAMVYQNFRVLIPTLFSSMSDPLGIAVRGGDLNDAFDAMKIGFKEVAKRWKNDESVEKGSLMDLSEMIGTVDAGTFMESLGQTYSSLYMSGKTKRANDMLFKWNGMEAWNRGMRAGATQAAIKFIKRHIETPNKDSARYLKELFPDGVNPTLKDGELDFMDPKVQQGIMRWVDGAILSPNAAQRPTWASDPHYALFFHMKQFTYSFHKVILKRAWNEATIHGNAAPALVLIAGYVPVVIAADAAKYILISGGDEPYWMQRGFGDTISHGIERANLFGIPQMGYGAFSQGKKEEGYINAPLEGLASLAGPTTGWAKDWYDKPMSDQLVASLPGGNVWPKLGGPDEKDA